MYRRSGEGLGGADSPLLPLTPRPDAALGLLLGVRVAWSHLLPLSIRNRAPKWTHLFEGRRLGLPFQRYRVRLSRLWRPRSPVLHLSPRGPNLPSGALPARGPNEPFAKPPWQRGRGTGRGLSAVTSVSHVTLSDPQRLLLAQPHPLEFVRGAA